MTAHPDDGVALSISAFFNRPLALRRNDAELLARNPGNRSDAVRGCETSYADLGQVNGVALIPVRGILARDVPWFADGTNYAFIRESFDAALADPAIRAVVLYVDSPGGDVAGCADLADHIYANRGTKPIWAILDESAYSAAYWLACAADRVTVPRTGGAGSIGVVCCHVDLSKMLANAGIEVTYIQSGNQKTDGAAEKPLSSEARKRVQVDIDQLGELFINTVARNRRRGLSRTTVRAMQAGCFLGPQAVANGLCDEVLAPDAAFRSLLSKIARRPA
jgi:signal peptide peptidase SppA